LIEPGRAPAHLGVSMLSVSNLSRSHGGHTILESISFIINRGERAGLIGPNGAGKSTLLRMIAGFEPPDGGSTSLSPGERVGMLRQGFADLADGSLADLLDIPTDGLATAARDLEQTLAASDGSDDWLQTYDAVQTYFDALGGYDRVAELETMLAAFGLESRSWVTPLAKLSGGEKTRAGLAALIVSRPDFLLLDEPTNHLDAEGQRFLADLLRQFDGGVLIVSHDRRFLDEVVTRLLILDDQSTGLELFSGNYSAYREAKEREAELRAPRTAASKNRSPGSGAISAPWRRTPWRQRRQPRTTSFAAGRRRWPVRQSCGPANSSGCSNRPR
jgi:ATP-binding cassette subfamily F protein 3